MLTYIKRRYYDLRQAWGLIAPIFGYINFVLIFYNFSGLKDSVSIEYFAIFFSIGAVVVALLVGNTFRKKQYTTDLNLSYERAGENAKTARIQLETYKIILDQMNITISDDLKNRITYLRKIETGTI